uniref:Uncharacterized protein n=1 Tax=Cacopsylla melanoneura TaxID=428564 RepID=A0A8D8T2W5_9HEMI
MFQQVLVFFTVNMIVKCFRITERLLTDCTVSALILNNKLFFLPLLINSTLEFFRTHRGQFCNFSLQVVPVPISLVVHSLSFSVLKRDMTGYTGKLRHFCLRRHFYQSCTVLHLVL